MQVLAANGQSGAASAVSSGTNPVSSTDPQSNIETTVYADGSRGEYWSDEYSWWYREYDAQGYLIHEESGTFDQTSANSGLNTAYQTNQAANEAGKPETPPAPPRAKPTTGSGAVGGLPTWMQASRYRDLYQKIAIHFPAVLQFMIERNIQIEELTPTMAERLFGVPFKVESIPLAGGGFINSLQIPKNATAFEALVLVVGSISQDPGFREWLEQQRFAAAPAEPAITPSPGTIEYDAYQQRLEEERYDRLRALGATEAEIDDIQSRKFWNDLLGPQGTVWELLNAAGAAVAVTSAGRGSPNSVVRANRPRNIAEPGLIGKNGRSPAPSLPKFVDGGKTSGILRFGDSNVPLLSGRTGPGGSLPKPAPGFNAITSTHVEGHAAAMMRQLV